MTTPAADRAYQKFMEVVSERRAQDERRRSNTQEVIVAKNRALIPMRQLLKRLTDMNLVVANASLHTGGVSAPNSAPVAFTVSEGISSERWQPGHSLYFDHPAEVEIAIPNTKDQADVGVVVITCATPHPDASFLNGPFRSMEEACIALAEFIARNTEHASPSEG